MTIGEILFKYKNQIDFIDIEILIAHSLGKTREFVLMHPEFALTKEQESTIDGLMDRRIEGEPVAYLIGHKEFYGLDFMVNKLTLIPRPETEMMVEEVLSSVISHQSSENNTLLHNKLPGRVSIIDVGTGSGCIVTSIAHEAEKIQKEQQSLSEINFFATDISKEALKLAKRNAKAHGLDKKIKFLHGNLLSPFIQDTKYKIRDTNLIITANLPYLSDDIYNSAPVDVKKYEPKSALYSAEAGLAHYRELLEQIKSSVINHQTSITCYLEISPEQKSPINKLIKSIFPKAKIEFQKDLAGKWRLCLIKI